MQTFDSDAALLDVSTIQQVSVSKATQAAKVKAKHVKEKEERRQRRKARKEMKRLVLLAMKRNLKGFGGVVAWRCLSVSMGLGLVGGRQLRLPGGFTLVRNPTPNPSKRKKASGTSYPPLLQQQQNKTTKMPIPTEVSARAKVKEHHSLELEWMNIKFTS